MKKQVLFASLFASVGLMMSAQTVQNIPNTEYLGLDGEYSKITIATVPDDGSEPKARTKVDNDGIWQFDNMCDRDVAELKINNTVESPYVINFETGSKNDGSTLLFEILNGDDIEWSDEYSVVNNAQWNKFIPAQMFVVDPLTVGEKTLRITFKNINGGSTNVANVRKLVFEPRAEIVNYSLYTYIDPSDEAGTITLSPDQNSYLSDSEVTITAKANPGWKFLHFENSYGDILEDNPYKIIMTEDADLTAYFQEVLMYSTIPGSINFDTRTTGKGKPESKAVSLDGESYNDGVEVMYLANYRHNDTEEFELDVTKDGEYTLLCPYSSKQENPVVEVTVFDKDEYLADPAAEPEATFSIQASSTSNWQKFISHKVDGINLTKGRKIMRMLFTESVATKYTVNFLYLKLGIGEDFGDEEVGIEGVAADAQQGEVRAYNLQGVRVSPDTKGLIIVNNEKVYNK